MKRKTVLILSGGLDSAVLLWWLPKISYHIGSVKCLTFDYGQKHRKEIESARELCKAARVHHKILDISSIGKLLHSSITNPEVSIPEGHYQAENMESTVVPGRNLIMLSIAMGYAASSGFDSVAIAAHGGDHFIYPDCRPEFLLTMNRVGSLFHFSDIKVLAPFRYDSKTDIVKKGKDLDVPFELTWTCYNGREKACGKCGSCIERMEAFKLNNLKDPIDYEN